MRRVTVGALCAVSLCGCRSPSPNENDLRDIIDLSDSRPLATYLRGGGDPNAIVGRDGERLLHVAAALGAEAAVRMLIAAGADQDAEYFGDSALERAAMRNRDAICRILARPDAKETREEARRAIAVKAFKKGMWASPQSTYILEIDGHDPDERVLKELQSLGYHVKAASESKEEATVSRPRLRVTFAEWIDDQNVKVSTELDRGPLAGGSCEEWARKRYGCWILVQTSSSVY